MALGIRILGILFIIIGIFQALWGVAVTGFGGLSWLTGLLFSQNMQSFGGR